MHLQQSRSRVYCHNCNPAFRDHSPYMIQVAYHLLYAECQYSLGNWEVARTYYSSALQLTGGENPRACTASRPAQRPSAGSGCVFVSPRVLVVRPTSALCGVKACLHVLRARATTDVLFDVCPAALAFSCSTIKRWCAGLSRRACRAGRTRCADPSQEIQVILHSSNYL